MSSSAFCELSAWFWPFGFYELVLREMSHGATNTVLRTSFPIIHPKDIAFVIGKKVRGSSVAGLPSKACPLTRRQVRTTLPSNKSQDTSQLHIQRFSPPQKSPKEERLTQRPPRAGPHSTLSSNGTNTNAPHRLGAPIPEELTDLDCGTSPMVKAEHIYDTCPYANIIPVNTLQILQCQRSPASPQQEASPYRSS